MKKIIIIKYAELTTKKDNIGLFLSALKKNITHTLSGLDTTIKYDKGRMFIFLNKDNYEEVVEKVTSVFGIHEIIVGYELSNDYEVLKQELVNLVIEKDFNTFKVETKRSDKT